MRHPHRLAVLTALLVAAPLGAQTPAPAAQPPPPLLTTGDLWVAGGALAGTLGIAPFDRAIAEAARGAPQGSATLRHIALDAERAAVPGVFIATAGLYVVGRLGGGRDAARVGLRTGEALAIGLAADGVLKALTGRARPYVGHDSVYSFRIGRGFAREAYRSFPSGHAVVAFAAAAVLTEETTRSAPDARWVVGPLLYAGAATVGLARSYTDHHWASDVVAGAALGTWTGVEVVRYHAARPSTRLDRWLLGLSIRPAPDGTRRIVRLIVAPLR